MSVTSSYVGTRPTIIPLMNICKHNRICCERVLRAKTIHAGASSLCHRLSSMRVHDLAKDGEMARLAMLRKSYDPAAAVAASGKSYESSGREALFPLMPPCYSARPQQVVVSPRVLDSKSPLATLPTPPASRPSTNNSPRAAPQQPRAMTALPGMRLNGQASPGSAYMNTAWLNAPASSASAPLPLKFDTRMSYPIEHRTSTSSLNSTHGGQPYVDEQLRKLRQKNRELQTEVREVNSLLHFEREAHHMAHGQWATNREQGLQQAAAARLRQRRLRRGMIALAAAGAAKLERRRRSQLVRAAGARLQRPRLTAYFAHWRRTVAEGAARQAEDRQEEEHASAVQARAPSSRHGRLWRRSRPPTPLPTTARSAPPARAQRGVPQHRPNGPLPYLTTHCPNTALPNGPLLQHRTNGPLPQESIAPIPHCPNGPLPQQHPSGPKPYGPNAQCVASLPNVSLPNVSLPNAHRSMATGQCPMRPRPPAR